MTPVLKARAHTDRQCGAEGSLAQPLSVSLSVSNCCFIRAWKRNPWLHLIKWIGMADPHNQSQSLSNMLHSVTTKLAWRKVNYGPSLCSSAGVAVLLYCFYSCFHYAHGPCTSHTCSPSLFIQSFPIFPFYIACSCMIHGLRVYRGAWCAISGIIKLTINYFCSQTNTCVTQWASVMLFIFHMFRVHADLFSLPLSLSLYQIFYSLFPYALYFLTSYPWVHLRECKSARAAR